MKTRSKFKKFEKTELKQTEQHHIKGGSSDGDPTETGDPVNGQLMGKVSWGMALIVAVGIALVTDD